METDETNKRIRKIKEEIFKKVKESIMIEEIVNEDIEKTAKSVKSLEEAAEAANNMEKIVKSKNVTFYGLHTNKAKYLKNSK